jgi:hypothetical protein
MLIQRAKEALHRGNHCDLKDSLSIKRRRTKDDTGVSQVYGHVKRYIYISALSLTNEYPIFSAEGR